MAHSTVVAIIAVIVIIGCVSTGWIAEEIRVRRQARRDAVNDDTDAYITEQGGDDRE